MENNKIMVYTRSYEDGFIPECRKIDEDYLKEDEIARFEDREGKVAIKIYYGEEEKAETNLEENSEATSDVQHWELTDKKEDGTATYRFDGRKLADFFGESYPNLIHSYVLYKTDSSKYIITHKSTKGYRPEDPSDGCEPTIFNSVHELMDHLKHYIKIIQEGAERYAGYCYGKGDFSIEDRQKFTYERAVEETKDCAVCVLLNKALIIDPELKQYAHLIENPIPTPSKKKWNIQI